MFSPLSLYLALRYTRARQRNHFISFIALVSMLGMMLGVAVLILVLSVMNGFDREMRERILGTVPHAVLFPLSGVDRWRERVAEVERFTEVVAAAPLIELEGMLSTGYGVRGAVLQGVAPQVESRVSIINEHFIAGSLDALTPQKYGIVLGDLLAAVLGVQLGDTVVFVLPETGLSPLGVVPRLRRFTVVGIFRLGAELDARLGLIHLEDAARLSRATAEAEGIRLRFTDVLQAPVIARNLAMQLGETYRVHDWTRQYGNLFASIQMEKRLVALLLFLIIAVAAFNIISSLVMTVTDKRAAIAILRTIGASRGLILRCFIIHGAITGVIGSLCGALLGILASWYISDAVVWIEQVFQLDFLSAETYFIDYLPSELRILDVVQITATALLISLLATIYPAWRATRIAPAEALRYE